MSLPLSDINAMDRTTFVAALGGIYENSPWVAEAAHAAAPFADIETLLEAMRRAVDLAGRPQQIKLIQAHPDLAGKAVRAGTLGEHSASEQAGAGLDRLTDEEYDRFHSLNTAYMNRFHFPFVIAVRRHTKASILEAFEVRLQNVREVEIAEALRNIHLIAEMRLRGLAAG